MLNLFLVSCNGTIVLAAEDRIMLWCEELSYLKLHRKRIQVQISQQCFVQELKNNKIEEDLDRGLSGAGHHLSSLGGGGVSMQVWV